MTLTSQKLCSEHDLWCDRPAHLVDQIRGFGFLHDDSVPTLVDFFRGAFEFGGRQAVAPFGFPDQPGRSGDQKVRELTSFLFTFPTGLAPVVGQQVTIDGMRPDRIERYRVLRQRADVGDCDLVVHGRYDGRTWSAVYVGEGVFQSDCRSQTVRESEILSPPSDGGDRTVLTATAVPKGSGLRMAIDRDEDGVFDRDELDAGSNPGDPG